MIGCLNYAGVGGGQGAAVIVERGAVIASPKGAKQSLVGIVCLSSGVNARVLSRLCLRRDVRPAPAAGLTRRKFLRPPLKR